jgi:hypothetical protein
VSFFADLPPRPEPIRSEDFRPPPWSGPPDNVVPGAVALEVLLARTDDAAVWMGEALAYPTGVTFTLHAVFRRPREIHHGRPPFMDPDAQRFGVRLADGRKAFADGGPPHRDGEGPLLVSRGGGGSDRRWESRLWLWPLPPPGPLTVAVAWPAAGIDEATVELDAAPIVEAAGRATELWPDERPERPDGGPSVVWGGY